MLVTLNPIPPSFLKHTHTHTHTHEYIQDQTPLLHVLETWGLGFTFCIVTGLGRDES